MWRLTQGPIDLDLLMPYLEGQDELKLLQRFQIQPDPITPPDKVFYADFIGQTRNGQEFPSNGTIPSDYRMWQPRLAVA